MTSTCSGDGSCLDPNVNNKRLFTCSHNCRHIKCPNYLLCGVIAPQWVYNCHNGRCGNCNISFGKDLTFKQSQEECGICLENKSSFVQLPACNHFICVECFRECYWPKNNDGEPPDDDDERWNNERCPFCRSKHTPYWHK